MYAASKYNRGLTRSDKFIDDNARNVFEVHLNFKNGEDLYFLGDNEIPKPDINLSRFVKLNNVELPANYRTHYHSLMAKTYLKDDTIKECEMTPDNLAKNGLLPELTDKLKGIDIHLIANQQANGYGGFSIAIPTLNNIARISFTKRLAWTMSLIDRIMDNRPDTFFDVYNENDNVNLFGDTFKTRYPIFNGAIDQLLVYSNQLAQKVALNNANYPILAIIEPTPSMSQVLPTTAINAIEWSQEILHLTLARNVHQPNAPNTYMFPDHGLQPDIHDYDSVSHVWPDRIFSCNLLRTTANPWYKLNGWDQNRQITVSNSNEYCFLNCNLEYFATVSDKWLVEVECTAITNPGGLNQSAMQGHIKCQYLVQSKNGDKLLSKCMIGFQQIWFPNAMQNQFKTNKFTFHLDIGHLNSLIDNANASTPDSVENLRLSFFTKRQNFHHNEPNFDDCHVKIQFTPLTPYNSTDIVMSSVNPHNVVLYNEALNSTYQTFYSPLLTRIARLPSNPLPTYNHSVSTMKHNAAGNMIKNWWCYCQEQENITNINLEIADEYGNIITTAANVDKQPTLKAILQFADVPTDLLQF